MTDVEGTPEERKQFPVAIFGYFQILKVYFSGPEPNFDICNGLLETLFTVIYFDQLSLSRSHRLTRTSTHSDTIVETIWNFKEYFKTQSL